MGNCCSSEATPTKAAVKEIPFGSGISVVRDAAATTARAAKRSGAGADVRVIAACADGKNSFDMKDTSKFQFPVAKNAMAAGAGGAATAAFCAAVSSGKPQTNEQLLVGMTDLLLRVGYKGFTPLLSTLGGGAFKLGDAFTIQVQPGTRTRALFVGCNYKNPTP